MNHQKVFTVPINRTPTLVKAMLRHRQTTVLMPTEHSKLQSENKIFKQKRIAVKGNGHAAKQYKTGSKFPLLAATNFMPITKMNHSVARFLCSLLFSNPREINYVRV